MTTKRKILIGIVVAIVLIQFIRPAKNKGELYTTRDFTGVVDVPDNVTAILEEACFDCHSNYTRSTWYDGIQPLGWWFNSHITDGKKELNFSEFGDYTKKRQAHKMEEIADEVRENKMPLNSYTWAHSKAKLTEEQKKVLIDWAQSNQRSLEADTAEVN